MRRSIREHGVEPSSRVGRPPPKRPHRQQNGRFCALRPTRPKRRTRPDSRPAQLVCAARRSTKYLCHSAPDHRFLAPVPKRSGRVASPATAKQFAACSTRRWDHDSCTARRGSHHSTNGSADRRARGVRASAAASISAPTSPVISADDQCGDGYEWSKTVGTCIPVPTRASTQPPGSTYQCVDGTSSKTSQGACSRHGGIDHPL
jgi:hypothetical protein